jgi:ubiquitin C-terminal hydrolase
MPVAKKRRKSDRISVHNPVLAPDNLLVVDSSSDPYDAISQPQTGCPYGDHRKKKNCTNNPWCLLDLIDEKKGIWKPQPSCMQKLGYDPAYMRRDVQGKSWKLTPSGIQNLGATCYLNVLIQMLHQNVLVRDAILNMQVDDSLVNRRSIKDLSKSEVEDSLKVNDAEVKDAHMNFVVGALQDTFGHLSSCVKGQHDLSLFVDLLELNKTEQQDPQEFSKLFFAKLDDSNLPLSDPKLPDIKQLISGKEIYSTTCTICGTVSSQSNEFREIGLNIEDCNSVELALNRYQTAEMLEGANQFSCSTCAKKTDARRRVEIAETPNLLILKLMRYYYDRKTNNKKKFQTALTFPPNLEVNNEEFELTAVLYHKGNSAHGGHYVAELLEWEENNWWLFDDCSVTPTLNPATSFTAKKRSKVAQSNGQGASKPSNSTPKTTSAAASSSSSAIAVGENMDNPRDGEMDVITDTNGDAVYHQGGGSYDRLKRQAEEQAKDGFGEVLEGPGDCMMKAKRVRKVNQHAPEVDVIGRPEKASRGRGRVKILGSGSGTGSGATVLDLSEEHALKLGNQIVDDNHPYITDLIDSPAKDVVSIFDCTSVEDDALDLRDTEKLQIKRKRGAKSSKPSHKKSASKDAILESGSGSAEGDGQGDGELSPSPSHSPNLDRSKVLFNTHHADQILLHLFSS